MSSEFSSVQGLSYSLLTLMTFTAVTSQLNLKHHFADDTSLTFSNDCFKTFATKINSDLRNISHWLRGNKLSADVEKTELTLFRRKKGKLIEDIKIKFNGKKLLPTRAVKYLGILLDQHLEWSKRISQVEIKLSRAIGGLNNLRHRANSQRIV